MLHSLLACLVQQPLDIVRIADLIKANPAEAARLIRAGIGDEELRKGSIREAGTTLFIAVEAEPGDHEVVLNSADVSGFKLRKLDNTLYAAIATFADGHAIKGEIQVDGKTLRGGIQVELYQPNPYVQIPPGGMKGEIREMGAFKSQVYAGTTRTTPIARLNMIP
ncbi:MAG: hypothetical protein ABL962_21095 [Fimbriimonadaceae bacterium]